MAPARDWLMTAVGPPPWAIRILDRKASRSAQNDYCPSWGSGRQRQGAEGAEEPGAGGGAVPAFKPRNSPISDCLADFQSISPGSKNLTRRAKAFCGGL